MISAHIEENEPSPFALTQHRCPLCSYEWWELTDAGDYPYYCPGCGEPYSPWDSEVYAETEAQAREGGKGQMPLSEIRRVLERGEWWDKLRDTDPDCPEVWFNELQEAIEAALDKLSDCADAEKGGEATDGA